MMINDSGLLFWGHPVHVVICTDAPTCYVCVI